MESLLVLLVINEAILLPPLFLLHLLIPHPQLPPWTECQPLFALVFFLLGVTVIGDMTEFHGDLLVGFEEKCDADWQEEVIKAEDED